MKNDLLKPTLNKQSIAGPIYPAQAFFLVSFFGGPLASIFFSLLNSHILERLRRDAWLHGVIALFTAAFYIWYTREPPVFQGVFFDWLAARRESSVYRYAPRAFSLIVWVILYSYYRAYYSANEYVSAESTSKGPIWRVSILCVIAGSASQIAIVAGLLFIKPF